VVTADATSAPVSGLTLRLQPGATLRGRVAFEGTRERPASLALLRIMFTNVAGSWSSMGFGTTMGTALAGSPSVTKQEDGTFSATNIAPGRYQLTATVAGDLAGWVMQSALVNGRDILDVPLHVTGPEPLEAVLRFTDRRTQIAGTLQDASGRPATEYYIVAFTTDRTLWRPGARRVKVARPGTDGRFNIEVPPGEYFVAAVTDVIPGEWDDPAFLEQLSAASARLTLAEGETKVQDYRIR
jgi:hypothetical protein